MRYYLDQEFYEDFILGVDGRNHHYIDLISIGIVCEDGREYYAICSEFDEERVNADSWMRENVLAHLDPNIERKTKDVIVKEIKEFCTGEPEFWGYYADYDWVLFCSLFGRMSNLPKGFPMYCCDLQQEIDMSAFPDSKKPVNEQEHNALADARWNMKLHQALDEWNC